MSTLTGEVTLTGRVLPIGGVKEKVLAARRSGVRRAIFPEGNRHDFEELAADLKEVGAVFGFQVQGCRVRRCRVGI